ncbi:MAG: hypothetical protein WCI55_15450 [Armatimonadota bacterium]
MGIFEGIMGIAGTLGGLSNAGAGRESSKKGKQYLDESRSVGLEDYRRRMQYYHDGLASGRFNAEPLVAQATKEAERATKVGSSAIAARLGGLGYKKGDSNATQDQRHFSEQSQLALSKMLMQIRQSMQENQNQELRGLSQVAGQYSNNLRGIGDDFVDIGTQQQANSGLGNAFGSLAGIDWGTFDKPSKDPSKAATGKRRNGGKWSGLGNTLGLLQMGGPGYESDYE